MNDNVKGSDHITGSVTPDPATQALLDKLFGTARMIGPALLSTLPTSPRMLQALAHALAHEKVAPEYVPMLSNVAMLMTVGEVIREGSGADVRVVPITPEPAQAGEDQGDPSPCPILQNGKAPNQVAFSGNDILQAHGMMVGLAHADGMQHIGITMCVELAGRHEHVIGMLDAVGARAFAERMMLAVKMIEAGEANPGSIN